MSVSRIFLLLLCLLPAALVANEAPDNSSEARLARLENNIQPVFRIEGRDVPVFNVEARMRDLGIPGVSVAFATNGKIDWVTTWGMADVAGNVEMTPKTLLLAGSISKPVAALRVHQMVEAGEFDLDENVNNYLSSWQVPDNEFTTEEKVTLRRILNHTAGLTVWGFPGYDPGDDVPSVVQVLDGEGNTDPVRVYKTPGESWMYSGGGYTIMQLAITDQLGVGFPETMKEQVLVPLGMPASTFDNPLPDARLPEAAVGYRGNGDEVEGRRPIYPEMAAAGLWTTPSELIQPAIELQRILQSGEDGFLKADTVSEMLTPGMEDHGLGPAASELRFGHGGADEGFRASMVAYRDHPHAWVIMVNSDNGRIIRELELAIATEYGLPGVEPLVRSIMAMEAEAFEKYTGTYNMEFGWVTFEAGEDALLMTWEGSEETHRMLPQSETEFFNEASGSLATFTLEDGIVTGFEIFGRAATRSESQD